MLRKDWRFSGNRRILKPACAIGIRTSFVASYGGLGTRRALLDAKEYYQSIASVGSGSTTTCLHSGRESRCCFKHAAFAIEPDPCCDRVDPVELCKVLLQNVG